MTAHLPRAGKGGDARASRKSSFFSFSYVKASINLLINLFSILFFGTSVGRRLRAAAKEEVGEEAAAAAKKGGGGGGDEGSEGETATAKESRRKRGGDGGGERGGDEGSEGETAAVKEEAMNDARGRRRRTSTGMGAIWTSEIVILNLN